MFTNQVGCTVYERTVSDDRMETYIRHFIPDIYWENTTGQMQMDRSMKQLDSVLCIIPSSSLSNYIPKRDDRIVCGRCDDADPPKDGARSIMQVKDFLYGSPEVQHIEVKAV